MPWRDPPNVDFFDQPQYRWHCDRVGFKQEDLFGDLHARFNTAPMFLQDSVAFHTDVDDIARRSESKADFLEKLQERRDQRLAEHKKIFNKIAVLLMCGRCRQEDECHISDFIKLSWTASLDSLLSLLATFLDPDQQRQLEILYPGHPRVTNEQNQLPVADHDSSDSDPKSPISPPDGPPDDHSITIVDPTDSLCSTPEATQHDWWPDSPTPASKSNILPPSDIVDSDHRVWEDQSTPVTSGVKRKRSSHDDDDNDDDSIAQSPVRKHPRPDPDADNHTNDSIVAEQKQDASPFTTVPKTFSSADFSDEGRSSQGEYVPQTPPEVLDESPREEQSAAKPTPPEEKQAQDTVSNQTRGSDGGLDGTSSIPPGYR